MQRASISEKYIESLYFLCYHNTTKALMRQILFP